MKEFYQTMQKRGVFDQLAEQSAYSPLPADWVIGVADIVGSTREVKAGRYKMVNTVGAAVISAQINAVGNGQDFPFVFGGDGAALAVWPQQTEAARDALAAVKRWALEEFDIELRAALVPVSAIRDAGFSVGVAKYSASAGVEYAMFSGGGVSWAEKQMKQGRFAVEIAPAGTLPDLDGLSCRWTPMKSQRGTILSLLVQPHSQADAMEVAKVMHAVVGAASALERGGHPVPKSGPGVSWPPEGVTLEAHASRGRRSLFIRRLQLLAETLLAWIFFRTGMKAGEFDPGHYARTTGANSDFQKFEDGLKMTLDCDPATKSRLIRILDAAREQDIIRYGLFEQDESIMTCIVPSITSDDHFHFVDGARGGYTMAAEGLKQSRR